MHASKRLVILVQLQPGNQKNCLMIVLKLLHSNHNPGINYFDDAKIRVKIDGRCL